MIKSVYIHIPFCNNICSYCDFCKMYYQEDWVNKYLVALEHEITKKYQNEEIQTIYIGGGTPSSLSIKQLKKLFQIIKKINVSKNLEFTFECNIENITLDKIKLLKENGVNRLSIGIESFNPRLLQILNREKVDFFKTKQFIKKIKELGIDNINIDLIYSLQSQTLEELKKDLDLFIELDIKHISIYSLILEKNTKLYIEKYTNASEELELEMYQYIHEFLTKNNYEHYEISNFSKTGYESKHNLTYWNNLEYYGFGLGASGYINNIRYTNTRNLNKYIKNEFVLEEEQLSQNNKMELEMILGLRKKKGVNTLSFEKKYHKKIEEVFNIKKLLENRQLIIENDQLYINPKYIYISNEILIHFLID